MTKSDPEYSDPQPTLLLSGADLARLMRPRDYLVAVEHGFRAMREGRVAAPPPLHLPATGGALSTPRLPRSAARATTPRSNSTATFPPIQSAA